MRRKLVCAMVAGALALARAATPAVAACPTVPGSAYTGTGNCMNGNHVKPSSLAPGPRAPNNAYGAPIPKPILTKRTRPKSKSQPQLHSSPLPSA
jgi:hypothetical protein